MVHLQTSEKVSSESRIMRFVESIQSYCYIVHGAVFEILQQRLELPLCARLLQKTWQKDIAKWFLESYHTCQKYKLLLNHC